MRRACIMGATGLLGGFCLNMLLQSNHYGEIVSIVRKRSGILHPKLREMVVDFDNLSDYRNELKANHYFCCIGTTIKKAGTKEKFKKVDYEYPLKLAEIAASHEASVFSVITAMGADSNSLIFYNKVKGELQDKLKKVPIPSINVLQPSLLLGEREELRAGEKVGALLMKSTSFLMQGALKKYKAIDAVQVAKAMVSISIQENKGFNIYTSDKLWDY